MEERGREELELEAWMAERAREELELLETQHPTRFNYLKLELKSLICCVAVDVDTSAGLPPTSAALTQASSSNRKRKSEWGAEPKHLEQHRKKKARKSSTSEGCEGDESGDGNSKKGDSSVDAAVRRAEACLQRIRQVKQSLFG